ncbi:hypothetical protein B296_00002521 [Ensete ventricosum]|uniref:Uncharacterized protein n=1 Tax=Ensete ventricosum TaxID=4639 RepID=A0A427AUA5_ENSVE|nr:hypothetical protein B296_00002521 [Ensete ventricosum]
MLGRSQVRASRRGSNDVVGSSPGTHQKFAGKFVGRLSGARQVFTERMLEVRWEFTEGNRELIKNSPEVCREVCREFTAKLLRARREFDGRMLGVR